MKKCPRCGAKNPDDALYCKTSEKREMEYNSGSDFHYYRALDIGGYSGSVYRSFEIRRLMTSYLLGMQYISSYLLSFTLLLNVIAVYCSMVKRNRVFLLSASVINIISIF